MDPLLKMYILTYGPYLVKVVGVSIVDIIALDHLKTKKVRTHHIPVIAGRKCLYNMQTVRYPGKSPLSRKRRNQ
jgi:hypothetical protein